MCLKGKCDKKYQIMGVMGTKTYFLFLINIITTICIKTLPKKKVFIINILLYEYVAILNINIT